MSNNHCPHCETELTWQDGLYHCPHCDIQFKKISYCPDCKNVIEKLQACGAVSYFCNHCNELKSKSRVTHQFTE